MKTMRRRILVVLTVLALVAAMSATARGFATFGSAWAAGSITMNMQLAGGAGLADGNASFNAAATSALTTWNQYLDRSSFAAVNGMSGRGGDGDLINQVFFDSNYYGTSFGRDTLAITTRWTLGGTQRVEADVVFNSAYQWDSYRGNVRSSGVWDLKRVALHEFGHALGLDHPDERGQNVNAIMNSIPGNLDALSADDIAGAQSLYGGGGVTGNVNFPPCNELNAYFNSLLAASRDELRAAPSPTYIDGEGAVIWLTEYARQRVGQCSHEPRNEGLLFMNQLDNTDGDSLRRSLGSSFVNNQGAVVWVLEYLRYRLNGCNHGDATTKVLQQIRGQGIQPVCSA